jgi:hypothetical protein
MRIHTKQFAVASAAILTAAAFAYQAAISSLYSDGKIVSSNLKQVDGTLYVPVKDVATFLGGTLNVTADRADIQTPAGAAATATSGGLAQAIVQEVAPPIAEPANPMATTAVVPPPVPTQLSGSMNQDIEFDGFSYRVTSIEYRDRDYKDQFDQRGTKLHPQWKTDRLAIVHITVKNIGTNPGTPTIPGTVDFSIFDGQKVAYPTTAVDIRQAPAVMGGDIEGDEMDYGTPLSFIAPGGELSYAVVGSLPKGNSVTMLRFHLSPPSFPDMQPTPPPQAAATPPNPNQPAEFNPSGADVTVNVG